MKKYIIHQ